MPSDDSVYVIYGWDAYYPPADGTIEVHEDEDTAREVVEALEEYSSWRNKDDKTDMLPDRLQDDPPNFQGYGYSERSFVGSGMRTERAENDDSRTDSSGAGD